MIEKGSEKRGQSYDLMYLVDGTGTDVVGTGAENSAGEYWDGWEDRGRWGMRESYSGEEVKTQDESQAEELFVAA